jgi:hypothetical protein
MSLTFSFDIKTSGLRADLLLDEKQARFASMLAINRTAEAVNIELARQIRSKMIVRRPAFILPPVPQLPRAHRATKQNLEAIAGLHASDRSRDDSDIRRRRAGILAPFETGGVKRQANEMRPVAIPTKALRADQSQLVPRSMYPTSLRLQPRQHAFTGGRGFKATTGTLQPTSRVIKGRTPGSLRAQLVGKRRTFVLDPENFPGLGPSAWGVYQRFGPGKRDIRMIWAYRRSVPIPDLLDFYAAADRIVTTQFWPNWLGLYDFAMRTAR